MPRSPKKSSKAVKPAAVVTGAARGIGFGVAKALRDAGYGVVIADRDAAATKRAVAELGTDVVGVVTDVASEAQVKKMIATAIKNFGGLDVLVNNAAIANPVQAPLETLSLQDWTKRLGVNLTSVFLCCKHAIPELRRRRGTIINVSSTRAVMSEPNTEAYATAKGGMDALTHALAVSLGPDVRVNSIRPGWIDTRDDRTKKPLSAKANAQHLVGRVGVPEDIAGLAVYLASPAAGFITGQTFAVDGGMTRKMIYEE